MQIKKGGNAGGDDVHVSEAVGRLGAALSPASN